MAFYGSLMLRKAMERPRWTLEWPSLPKLGKRWSALDGHFTLITETAPGR